MNAVTLFGVLAVSFMMVMYALEQRRPMGQAVRATAGAVGAFLFRHSDQVTAVSSIYSHLPCELNWEAGQAVLRCPCHLWTFTPDGRSTATISPLPNLHKVMVRVENGRVLVKGT